MRVRVCTCVRVSECEWMGVNNKLSLSFRCSVVEYEIRVGLCTVSLYGTPNKKELKVNMLSFVIWPRLKHALNSVLYDYNYIQVNLHHISEFVLSVAVEHGLI